MGPNFTKFVTMGIVWEENLRLPILWENYGKKVPIHIPQQSEFPQLPFTMALIWDIHSVEYAIDYLYPLRDGQHNPQISQCENFVGFLWYIPSQYFNTTVFISHRFPMTCSMGNLWDISVLIMTMKNQSIQNIPSVENSQYTEFIILTGYNFVTKMTITSQQIFYTREMNSTTH